MSTKTARPCASCRDGVSFNTPISMAFQPILDTEAGGVFAYEALVRGAAGEGAMSVLSQVTETTRYAFDQRCRVVAIEKAVEAGIVATGARLSINFLPGAVYSPQACIQLTLRTAARTGLPTDRLMFEFVETEQMADPAHVANIISSYRAMGFSTAIDDFGAGYAGLTLLARFQPDLVKIDMELIRGLEASMPRRMIVEAVIGMCRSMNVGVIAEGVETEAEYAALRGLGVRYMQGYLFARPAFQALPEVALPDIQLARAA